MLQERNMNQCGAECIDTVYTPELRDGFLIGVNMSIPLICSGISLNSFKVFEKNHVFLLRRWKTQWLNIFEMSLCVYSYPADHDYCRF